MRRMVEFRKHALVYAVVSVLCAALSMAPALTSHAEARPWDCQIPTSQSDPSDGASPQSPAARNGDGDLIAKPQCGVPTVPSRLFVGGTSKINTKAFPVKTRTGYRESRGQAWSIDKDTAGHGGRAWKLKNPKGKRVASLAPDGAYLAP